MKLRQRLANYINDNKAELVYAMMYYSGNVNYKLIEELRSERK